MNSSKNADAIKLLERYDKCYNTRKGGTPPLVLPPEIGIKRDLQELRDNSEKKALLSSEKIKNIIEYKPLTVTDVYRIPTIGEKTGKEFGQAIVQIVRRWYGGKNSGDVGGHNREPFCSQFSGIVEQMASVQEESPFTESMPVAKTDNKHFSSKGEQKQFNAGAHKLSETVQETRDLITNGLSIQQIAVKRNLAESTIYEHIVKLIEKDLLNVSDFVSKTAYDKVAEITQNVQSGKLAEIKALCGDEITYADIRMVLADLRRKK